MCGRFFYLHICFLLKYYLKKKNKHIVYIQYIDHPYLKRIYSTCLKVFVPSGWFAQKLYLLVLPWNSTRPGDPSNVLFWFSSRLWCRGFTLFSPEGENDTLSSASLWLWHFLTVKTDTGAEFTPYTVSKRTETLRVSVSELNSTEFEAKPGVRLGWKFLKSLSTEWHSHLTRLPLFRWTSVFCAKCSHSSVLVRNAEAFVGFCCLERVKMTLRLFMQHVASTTEIETFALRSDMTTISAHRWEQFCLCVWYHCMFVCVWDILTHQTNIVTWILLDLPIADSICQTRMSTVTISDLTQIRCVFFAHTLYMRNIYTNVWVKCI